MENTIKLKTCRAEGCQNEFKPYRTTDKYCSFACYKQSEETPVKKKRARIIRTKSEPIRKVSDKMQKLLRRYYHAKKAFMAMPENKYCAVYPHQPADQIHHKMGREGYADDWARRHDIPLLIDVRYFLAVGMDGHRYIEENPIWAKKKGFSKNRLGN